MSSKSVENQSEQSVTVWIVNGVPYWSLTIATAAAKATMKCEQVPVPVYATEISLEDCRVVKTVRPRSRAVAAQ